MADLSGVRRYYAEEIRAVSNLRTEALVAALARVPREHFLGPGPWLVKSPAAGYGRDGFRPTPSDDPAHLYHNVIVAIDAEGRAHNGQPSGQALWIDSLDLAAGERVLHVGCGVGYYTALIADVVGPTGRVVAVEIDTAAAAVARRNLAGLRHVEVVCADGNEYDPGPADAAFINAGVTRPRPLWLDCLREAGRLVFPLATREGRGTVLRVARLGPGFAARFLCPVSVLPCVDSRSEEANRRLVEAFGGGGWRAVRSVRAEPHPAGDDCWLHAEGFCLSTLPPPPP